MAYDANTEGNQNLGFSESIDMLRKLAAQIQKDKAKRVSQFDTKQPNAWMNRAGTELGDTISQAMLMRAANNQQQGIQQQAIGPISKILRDTYRAHTGSVANPDGSGPIPTDEPDKKSFDYEPPGPVEKSDLEDIPPSSPQLIKDKKVKVQDINTGSINKDTPEEDDTKPRKLAPEGSVRMPLRYGAQNFDYMGEDTNLSAVPHDALQVKPPDYRGAKNPVEKTGGLPLGPSDDPTGPNSAFKPMQHLGGPMAAGAPPPDSPVTPTGGPDLPGLTPQPAQTPHTNSPNSSNPTYPYQVPPARPLESREQLDAILRATPMEKWGDVIKSYQERSMGDKYKTPTGELYVQPRAGGQGQPNVTHVPGEGAFQELLGFKMIQGPDGKFHLIAPDGSGINSIEDMNKWKGKLEGEKKSVTDVQEYHTKNLMTAMEDGLKKAPGEMQLLRQMQVANENDWTPRGPGAAFMLEARQLLSNYGQNVKGTPDAEVLQKLNGFLAGKAASALSDRSSAFTLDTYMKSNPGLVNTQAGTRKLLDLMQQETEQRIRLGRAALNIDPAHAQEFTKLQADFYKNNPIIMTGEDGRKWTTKKIEHEEDIPEDMIWFDSKGNQHFGRDLR